MLSTFLQILWNPVGRKSQNTAYRWANKAQGVGDRHGPGSASSMQVPQKKPHWNERGRCTAKTTAVYEVRKSIWLKNCWITKDNHGITHRTGKNHQGHNVQSSEDWSLHHHFTSKPTFTKLMCQSRRVSLLPSRGSICNLSKKTCCQHTKYLHLPPYELQHTHNKEC